MKRTETDDLIDEARDLEKLLLLASARLVAFTEQLGAVVEEEREADQDGG